MIRNRSIAELGKALRSREVTAVEVAQSAITAVEADEAELNAFITVTSERALDEAHSVDEQRARGVELGPLMGIPWAIKDVFATEGARTTGGSDPLADFAPTPDADIVRSLKAAGAVLVGKTNLHELGWGLSPTIGRTNNPHDLARGSGGSSGGSAATVAAGALPFAIGTDAGGSIRMPAAFCAVVGFKPTHGRVSMRGHLPGSWTVGDAGPLARSVADVIAACNGLGVLGPIEPRDAKLRVGVVEGSGATSEIGSAYAVAVDRLAGAA